VDVKTQKVPPLRMGKTDVYGHTALGVERRKPRLMATAAVHLYQKLKKKEKTSCLWPKNRR